jgi:hypothetical protein
MLLDRSKATRLQTHPRLIDFVGYASLLTMMSYGIIGIFDIISWFIFVFIAIASFSFWSVPSVVKGAILLFFVLRHGTIFLSFLAWTPVVSVVCAIVYTYAKSTLGTLGTLDYVFISLSIVGNVGAGVGILFYKYIIAPKLYDEWLLVFSPEWPHVNLPWVQKAQTLRAWSHSWIDESDD